MYTYPNNSWQPTKCVNCGGFGMYMHGDNGPWECKECGGNGELWIHRSGMVAMYPGGPARGSWKTEAAFIFAGIPES